MTVLLDLIDEVSGIKQDIKTAINNKGGSLDNDTPFADYATAIGNIPSSDAVLEKTLSGDQTFNVQSLGTCALSDNFGMTSISLPNCTSLSERCIQNCKNLESASLPVYEGWTLTLDSDGDAQLTINGGHFCFEYCDKLKTAYLPSLKIIPEDFFAECKALSTLTASGIYGLCGNSFRTYEEWEPIQRTVTAYEQIVNLGLDFINFKYLQRMSEVLRDYINDSNNNVTNTLSFPNLQCCGQIFAYEDSSDVLYNITTVNVPDLRRINDWAQNIWNVTSIDLPLIRTLGMYAFSNMSSLTTINIGSKVKHIAQNAFNNCNNVTTVNIDIDQNTQDQDIINNVINTAPWGLDQSVTINWLGQ